MFTDFNPNVIPDIKQRKMIIYLQKLIMRAGCDIKLGGAAHNYSYSYSRGGDTRIPLAQEMETSLGIIA